MKLDRTSYLRAFGALSAALLSAQPALAQTTTYPTVTDARLEEDGPRYIGTDIAALAWRFGPPGHPVARGIDILAIRDGRVNVVRTLIAP